jgi:hypothetical protein
MTSPPPNFDRIARHYHWMERLSFGPWLWRCRCNFLEEMKNGRRALVLGDGDGRFTAHLLRENPLVRVDTMDASPAMMRELLRRAGDQVDRVDAQVLDVRTWSPIWDEEIEKYDLVVTHFFLDCLTTGEVEALAAKLRMVMSAKSIWVVSDFAIPAGRRRPPRIQRWIVSMLYRAFRWMTGLQVQRLPFHGAALRRMGFLRWQKRNWLGGLLLSECWARRDGGQYEDVDESSAGHKEIARIIERVLEASLERASKLPPSSTTQ